MFKHCVIGVVLLLLSAPALAKPPQKGAGDASGAQEVPEVSSISSGQCSVKFDKAFTTAEVTVKVKGLADENITGAHLHCAPAGANGPVAFGMFSPGPGIFENGALKVTLTNADAIDTDDDCSDEIDMPANNIAALAYAIREGMIYCNIHSTANMGGEIRAQMSE